MGNDIIGAFFTAVDAQAMNVVQSLYNALTGSLRPVFLSALTVYVIYWGYEMLFGRAPLSAGAVLWKIVRVMLIYTIALAALHLSR